MRAHTQRQPPTCVLKLTVAMQAPMGHLLHTCYPQLRGTQSGFPMLAAWGALSRQQPGTRWRRPASTLVMQKGGKLSSLGARARSPRNAAGQCAHAQHCGPFHLMRHSASWGRPLPAKKHTHTLLDSCHAKRPKHSRLAAARRGNCRDGHSMGKQCFAKAVIGTISPAVKFYSCRLGQQVLAPRVLPSRAYCLQISRKSEGYPPPRSASSLEAAAALCRGACDSLHQVCPCAVIR